VIVVFLQVAQAEERSIEKFARALGGDAQP
jgi:hypothetical protein